jgi:hypothetical protein
VKRGSQAKEAEPAVSGSGPAGTLAGARTGTQLTTRTDTRTAPVPAKAPVKARKGKGAGDDDDDLGDVADILRRHGIT